MCTLLASSDCLEELIVQTLVLAVTMKAIIVFVCVFANQVTSQSVDIFPGKIFTNNKVVREGSELTFKCSPHGATQTSQIYLYLCKNGQGLQRKRQKEDQTDIIFTVQNVRIHHSGNYSCVYSTHEYDPPTIYKIGSNTIGILVIAAFLPAQISLVGSSTVTEGDIFELECTVDANTVQMHTECKQIRSYLMKNNTAVRTGAFSMKDMKATFSIHGATMTDSGQYSCVVLPPRCVQEEEAKFRGNNTVTVQVQEHVSYLGVQVMGLLSALLILGGILFGLAMFTAPWRKCFTVEPIYSEAGGLEGANMMDIYDEPDLQGASHNSFATSTEENFPGLLNGEAECDGPDEAYLVPEASQDSHGMSAELNLPNDAALDEDYIIPEHPYADVQDLYSRCNKPTSS